MLIQKIGIAAACLRQPLKEALHTVSRLGARGVQIDARTQLRPAELTQTGARQFRKLLEDLNLVCTSVAFPTHRGYGNPEDLDRRVQATRQAMQMARTLGATLLVNQIGRVPDDPESETWRTLIAVLSDLGAYGQRTGVLLAAKTGSEGAADLNRLFAVLPDGAIGLDLDPGNLIANGYSAQEVATMLGQHVVHVTARDGVRDLAMGRGLETQLGRGTADFPALLGILEDHSYRGWLTIDRRETDDPIREAGDAVQFLQRLE